MTTRILVVGDFKDWRNQVYSLLPSRPEWQVVAEVSDGLEAAQRAVELQPELILLDIGLPKLNGIGPAGLIRRLVPDSKIIALSQESDADVAQELFDLGVSGYVARGCTEKELLTAVEAVLQGKQPVSTGLEPGAASPQGAKSDISFHFEFDSENKIFHAKFHGAVTDESIRHFYQTVGSRVGLSDFRASIVDFSGAASFHVTRDAIRELAALAPADPEASRPRVIVAPNALIFVLARLFQMTGQVTRPNLHVVRKFSHALALLGVAAPRFEPFEPRFPILPPPASPAGPVGGVSS